METIDGRAGADDNKLNNMVTCKVKVTSISDRDQYLPNQQRRE